MDTLFYTFAALLFAAVLLLAEGLHAWWSSTRSEAAKRIERRLQLLSAGAHDNHEQISIVKKDYAAQATGLERLMLTMPRSHALDRLLEQSGVGWHVPRFFTYTAFAFLCCTLACMVLGVSAWLSLLAGLAAAALPLLIVQRARNKRFVKLELQIPEATDLISRALRAGHAFPSALQMVRDEMPEPISGEFRIVADEINYGVPMNDALLNLVTRVPITDLRYFVVAVLIQRESGGNLAEILENIGYIIRERLKLLGRVRVLSAEGRMSAWILGLLPFAVALIISFTNPAYLNTLTTDPIGRAMVAGALTMMAIGVFAMSRIIRIRV